MKYLRIMGRHAGQQELKLFIIQASNPDEAIREAFRQNPTLAEAYYAGEASPSQIQEHNAPDDLPGE